MKHVVLEHLTSPVSRATKCSQVALKHLTDHLLDDFFSLFRVDITRVVISFGFQLASKIRDLDCFIAISVIEPDQFFKVMFQKSARIHAQVSKENLNAVDVD